MSLYLRLVSNASEVPQNEINPVPPCSVWYDGTKLYFFPKKRNLEIVEYTTSDGNILGINNGRDLFMESEGQGKIFVGEKYTERGSLSFATSVNRGFYSVCSQAFRKMDRLTTIELSDDIVKIESYAFNECTALQELHVPSHLEIIDDYAFKKCVSLENITFPNTLKTIGYGAFNGCTSLGTVNFNEGLEEIKNGAFSHCVSLKQITLPDTLKVIGASVFEVCTELVSVRIGEGVQKIENFAFVACEKLSSVWYKDVEYTSISSLTEELSANGVEVEIGIFQNTAMNS